MKKICSLLNCPQKRHCDNDTTEQEIIDAINSISNNNTSGNDRLTKEFYDTFWNKLKEWSINSLNRKKLAKD